MPSRKPKAPHADVVRDILTGDWLRHGGRVLDCGEIGSMNKPSGKVLHYFKVHVLKGGSSWWITYTTNGGRDLDRLKDHWSRVTAEIGKEPRPGWRKASSSCPPPTPSSHGGDAEVAKARAGAVASRCAALRERPSKGSRSPNKEQQSGWGGKRVGAGRHAKVRSSSDGDTTTKKAKVTKKKGLALKLSRAKEARRQRRANERRQEWAETCKEYANDAVRLRSILKSGRLHEVMHNDDHKDLRRLSMTQTTNLQNKD